MQTAYDNLCVSSGTTALPHFLLKYTEESVEVAPLKDLKSFFPDLKKVIPCMDAPNVGQPKLFGEKTELIVTSANVWRHLKVSEKDAKAPTEIDCLVRHLMSPMGGGGGCCWLIYDD